MVVFNKINFKRDLFNPSKDKVSMLRRLKAVGDFETIFSVLKESLSHPVVKTWVFASPYPKTYEELRKNKIIGITGNFLGEIIWNLLPCVKEYKKINWFLSLKKSYEKNILLGDYQSAADIMREIEDNFGYSVWLLENKLIISQLSEGTEANWVTLSEMTTHISDGLLLYFAEHFSKKAEDKISYTRYKDIITNQINELNVSEEFSEYLIYRLNYLGLKKYYNYEYFLSQESALSLIDRYLILRQILIETLETSNALLYKKIILKAKLIEDSLFAQVSNFLQLNDFIELDYTKRSLEILDLYTSGKYVECISLLPNEIKINPTCVELYDLYVKSLIEIAADFRPTGLSSLIDSILINLYNLYKKSNETGKAIDELSKIITIYFSGDWAKQLLALTNNLTSINTDDSTLQKFYLLYSTINNPKSPFDLDDKFVNSNLLSLKGKYLDNKCLSVLYSLNKGDVIQLSSIDGIPEAKRHSYILKAYYISGDFDNVIELGEKILKNNVSQYVLEEALVLMYKSYVIVRKFDRAILTYVDTYIKNANLVKRLDAHLLLKTLAEGFESVSDLIEFPIFYSISVTDPYQIYVAYDTFLSRLNVERPSEILSSGINFDDLKLILFLKDVCKFDVLKHSYNFISKDDIEQERLLLLDVLLKIDKKNENAYISEIATLTQNAAVKKALREVNKAKITINVDQLKEVESSNIREGYTRYKELESFSRNRNIKGIDISSKQLADYYKQLDSELKSKVIYTNDPAFISFKVMFLDIRDKFIFSKEFGLDGYLSTRIRHGTFQNYVRSVFESENLISQKNSDGAYVEIDYWKSRIPYQVTAKMQEIQNALHTFSKEIDDYTEFIIKELIQIRTEKHDKKPNALFDYSLSQSQLAQIFQYIRKEISDHKSFINVIFSLLIEQTEIILRQVKETFTKEITEEYISIIARLQDTIKDVLGSIPYPELMTAIMKCSTLIRREIADISEWFNISNPTSDLYLDISTLLQTSIQITNRIYPYKKINPDITIRSDYTIKGSIHLIYIARILLDNIILHSDVENYDLKVKIDVSTNSDGYLKMIFINNLAESIDLLELNGKLKIIKDGWQRSDQNFEKTDIEGGSGFDKIRRILKFDMKRANSSFDYEISNGYLSIIIGLETTVNEK
ncbi:MAG: hypothetical protein ACJ75B_12380 [Flavisolibacter sp.]